MKALRRIIMAATFAAAVPVWAGEGAKTSAAELAQAKEQLAQKYLTVTGGARQEVWLEQRKVQKLIDDLQAGRHVNPADIDRVLQDADREVR